MMVKSKIRPLLIALWVTLFALMPVFLPFAASAAINTPPVAVNDYYAVAAGVTLSVPAPGLLANDYDPDSGDALVQMDARFPSPPTYAASVYTTTGAFSLTPYAGVTGPVTFEYRVKDDRGAWSNWATVTINVIPSTAPIATDDVYAVPAGQTLEVPLPGLLANDYDPDGDTFFVTEAASAEPRPYAAAVYPSGGFILTPDLGVTGPVSFEYRLADSRGALSNWATVTVNVLPQARLRAVDDHYTIPAGGTLTLTTRGVLANDYAPAGSTIEFIEATHPSPAEYNATFTISGDNIGALTLTPIPGVTGPVGFTYRFQDNHGDWSNWASVTVNVIPNQPPVAVDQHYEIPVGGRLVLPAPGLLANDYDPDGDTFDLIEAVFPSPAQYSSVLTISGQNIGHLTLTPVASFAGSIAFEYRVRDSRGAWSNWATVTVRVGDPPSVGLVTSVLFYDSSGGMQLFPTSAPGPTLLEHSTMGNRLMFTVLNTGPSELTNVRVYNNLDLIGTIVSLAAGSAETINVDPILWTPGQMQFDGLVLADSEAGEVSATSRAYVFGAVPDLEASKRVGPWPPSHPTVWYEADDAASAVVIPGDERFGFMLYGKNTGNVSLGAINWSDSNGTFGTWSSVTPGTGRFYGYEEAWQPGLHVNTATFTASYVDSAGNSWSDTIIDDAWWYCGATDLAITKELATEWFGGTGNVFAFRVSITNDGPDQATGVVVTDVFPAGLTPCSPSADIAIAGQEVTWTVGTLAAGATRTELLYFTADGPGTWTNTATVAGVEFDSDPSNNEASAGVSIGALDLSKFYDADLDGLWGAAEPGLGCWRFCLAGTLGSVTQHRHPMAGDLVLYLDGTAVRATEMTSTIGWWVPTTPVTAETIILGNATASLKWGNVHLGAGGGRSIGFWSNRNGQRVFEGLDDPAGLLNALNLVNEDGSPLVLPDPQLVKNAKTYSTFSSWLTRYNRAKNMSRMLSAQLAAMALNVEAGYVNSDALVYGKCLLNYYVVDRAEVGLDDLGFIAVGDLMELADGLLGQYPTAYAKHPWRPLLECVKNVLDMANNNLNFLQATPGPYGGFVCGCSP